MNTRAQIQERLERLSIDLPCILRFESGGSPLDIFAGIANEILDSAEPADREYVWTQLEQLAEDNDVLLDIGSLDSDLPQRRQAA